MERITFKNIYGINIAANLYNPIEKEENKKYPAVVISGPVGMVKEQCTGMYAEKMAKNGFISIAFDPAFYGQSEGIPRYLADPNIEVENISAAIDFLLDKTDADKKRLAVIGMAEGGGFSVKAAMLDRRIEAAAVISPINYGRLIRTESEKNAITLLKKNSRKRTDSLLKENTEYVSIVPDSYRGSKDIDQSESWEYYNDKERGNKDSWENKIIEKAMDKAAGFDAFNLAEQLLTVPIMIIVGEKHGSFGAYKDADCLYEKAASKKKEYITMRESSHVSLYDDPIRVGKTIEMINDFLRKYL